MVKTGDVVKVKVMEVDVQRKRIALSMRLDDEVDARASCTDLPARNERKNRVKAPAQSTSAKPAMGSMGALLMNAQSAKDKKV